MGPRVNPLGENEMNLNKITKMELAAMLKERDAEIAALRHRVSVLEGEKALGLRASSAESERTVTIGGVLCRKVVERLGQCTRTRYIPVAMN